MTEQWRWPRRPNTRLALVSPALALLSLPGAWLLYVHCDLITKYGVAGE